MTKLIITVVLLLTTLTVQAEINRDEIKELQERLLLAGYPTKGVDGYLGVKTNSAIELYAIDNKLQTVNPLTILENLRTSQSAYLLISKKDMKKILSSIDRLSEKTELLTQNHVLSEKAVKQEFVAQKELVKSLVYGKSSSAIINFLIFLITSLVGAALAIYLQFRKLKKNTIKEVKKQIAVTIKGELEKAKNSFNNHTDEKIANTTVHVRAADAKIMAVISYALWAQAEYFRPNSSIRDENITYERLLSVALNITDDSIKEARSLPSESKYKEQRVENLINAAYYFTRQQTYALPYHDKAKEIIEEIKPLICDADIKRHHNWPEWIDSMLYVECVLKLRSNDSIMEDFEKLLQHQEDAWKNTKKQKYLDVI